MNKFTAFMFVAKQIVSEEKKRARANAVIDAMRTRGLSTDKAVELVQAMIEQGYIKLHSVRGTKYVSLTKKGCTNIRMYNEAKRGATA